MSWILHYQFVVFFNCSNISNQLPLFPASNCSNHPLNAFCRCRLRSGAILGWLLHLFIRQYVVSRLHLLLPGHSSAVICMFCTSQHTLKDRQHFIRATQELQWHGLQFLCHGLTELVAACKKKIPQEYPSISALKTMAFALKKKDHPTVDFEFCYSFKQSIQA